MKNNLICLLIKFLFCLLSINTLLSCNGDEESVSYHSFSNQDLIVNDGEYKELGLRGLLRKPLDFTIEKDLAYIVDEGYDSMILVVDLKKNSVISNFGEKGEGLGKLNWPGSILVSNRGTSDSIYVLDRIESKINVYTDKYVFSRQITLRSGLLFNYMQWVDQKNVILTTDSGEITCVFLNLETGKVSYPGNGKLYPSFFNLAPIPKDALPEFFASRATVDVEKNLIFLATQEIDVVQVYTTNGELVKRFRGPDYLVPEGVLSPDGYFARIEGKHFRAYNGPIFIWENLFFVGYSGRGPDLDIENDTKWFRSNKLIVYNTHSLKPVGSIHFKDLFFSAGSVVGGEELYLLDINPDKEGAEIVTVSLDDVF